MGCGVGSYLRRASPSVTTA